MPSLESLSTSKRRFGFKKGIGCLDSLPVVQSVIKYFNDNQSTVNITVIDIKKAFDKCSNYGILCMLQDRNVNVKLLIF